MTALSLSPFRTMATTLKRYAELLEARTSLVQQNAVTTVTPAETEFVMNHLPGRLLKLGEVIDLVGLGRTMIYRLIREGDFPAPFKPGGYSSRWSEDEVRAWIKAVGEARQ